jgi:hypothetical protein
MAEGPSNNAAAASFALDSSVDSSDSYYGDEARGYLREWRMAEGRYIEVTQENGRLETRLRVTEVALHTAEEETSATWARLAEADAMVAGKFHCFIVPESVSLLTSCFSHLPALTVQLDNL